MSERGLWLATFGCQMNVDDSERLAWRLSQAGFRPVGSPAEADLIVLNTCSVRAKAEQKVYSLLGQLKDLKRDRPETVVVLAGCLAQQEGRNLLARFDHLDLVVGTGALNRLPELLGRPGRNLDVDLDRELPVFSGLGQVGVPLRSQVTIMQGCDNFCAYCVVPYLRGRERCRPPEEILSEARARLSAGAREINLLGQNVNSYRHGPWDFVRLLRAVASLPGLWRLRFTTSHPKDMSPALMACFAELPQLVPFLHLPFQAGSDGVLKRMNRGYSRDDYLDLVSTLRKIRPDLALSADCIVGFPGETEADFEDTLDLIERVRFESLYSFCYSDRPLAPARLFQDKVDPAEARMRLLRLQACQKEITLASNQALEGRTVEVLVEGPAKRGEGLLTGRTPSNKVVNFPGPAGLSGRLVRVEVKKAWTNSLHGRLLKDNMD